MGGGFLEASLWSRRWSPEFKRMRTIKVAVVAVVVLLLLVTAACHWSSFPGRLL